MSSSPPSPVQDAAPLVLLTPVLFGLAVILLGQDPAASWLGPVFLVGSLICLVVGYVALNRLRTRGLDLRLHSPSQMAGTFAVCALMFLVLTVTPRHQMPLVSLIAGITLAVVIYAFLARRWVAAGGHRR